MGASNTVKVSPSPASAMRATAWVGLLVFGFTACGSASSHAPSATIPRPSAPPSPQALDSVAQATTRTLRSTSSFEMTFTHNAPSGASATPLYADGAVDFQSPSATIRIELPRGSGGDESMVFLPGRVFFKPPASSPPLQAGRPWIFANFADIAKYKINFPPYIVQTESINPAFTLDELAWGSTSAVAGGTSPFQGVTTDEYLVTVSLDRALSNATGPNGDVFARTLSSEISASGGAAPTMAVPSPSPSTSSGRRCTPTNHRGRRSWTWRP